MCASRKLRNYHLTRWGGFDWIRRRKPLACNGRGASTAAAKVGKCANSAILECGADNLWDWRSRVRNFLTDQCGTDRKLLSCPFSDVNTDGVLAALHSGELGLDAASVTSLNFLPNALDTPDTLHILWNAGEESVKRTDEWLQVEALIKAVVKNIGEHSYKERLLATSFKDAPPLSRKLVRSFCYSVVDWRWEHMSNLLLALCEVWEDSKNYYRAEDFEDGDVKTKVLQAIGLSWFGICIECFCLFLCCCGEEASKLEGCHCHDHHVASESRYSKRRKLLQDLNVPGGKRVWKGRHSTASHWEKLDD